MAKPRIQIYLRDKQLDGKIVTKLFFDDLFRRRSVFDKPFDWTEDEGNSILHIRLNSLIGSKEVLQLIKDKIATLSLSVSGKVSYHICPHDDPPEEQYSCRDDPRAKYEEIEF